MTKIILERHGQSLGNANRIFLGHTDLSLTEEGKEQARITAEHLKAEQIDAIYSSDLKRAYETALPHAELHGLEITKLPELRELFVGSWEGMAVAELRDKYYEQFMIRRSYRDFVYPNGEATQNAAERIKRALTRIAEANPFRTVLAVSHAAAIRAFWYDICGYADEDMATRVKLMPNASYAVLIYENGKFTPQEYGVCDHLPPTEIHPV